MGRWGLEWGVRRLGDWEIGISKILPTFNYLLSIIYYLFPMKLLLLPFFLLTSSLTSQNLPWRFIGPGAGGGRICDIEVHPKDHSTIYVAASTGGLFKTTDEGFQWTPIFDEAGTTLSIGDMALCQSDPNLLWVGTGEASGEQSSASLGDGVYKSTDAGQTWQHMGLHKTVHIARVMIDPTNPDIVFVAATGSRWGPNPERGLYRTRDGGLNWDLVLYLNDDTGISDMLVSPDGKMILASAYQNRRSAWAHVQKGPHSGLYRSIDGGDSWEKLTIGFATGNIGRIALIQSTSNPKLIYACTEGDQSGFYRSDDGGDTWVLKNDKVSTSYWYGRIFIHPTDDQTVWVMGPSIQETKNGGDGFAPMRLNVHVDHHIFWVNPDHSDHRLLGNDGGFYISKDGGKKWTFFENIQAGQNYAISVDTRNPYWVYGGLQDNGVVGIPNRTKNGDIPGGKEMKRIAGGDGFWSSSQPDDPMICYGESQYGGIVRYDHKTDKSKGIKPGNNKDQPPYRFNWNAPFFVSVHPPHTLYLGGNHLFKSTDRGDTWEVISGDLSKNRDLDTVRVMGQLPVPKPYASLTALAESPMQAGVIYGGTDDGNLQVTLNNGNEWTDITDRLPMPHDRFSTRILPSRFNASTVYVACARYYEGNDFTPYLFRSDDYGTTWRNITGNMPPMAVVKAIAEHPTDANILFVGIHNGLLITKDGGQNWIRIEGSLPPVAIDDIKISNTGALVLGSYGRGIVILDDINHIVN